MRKYRSITLLLVAVVLTLGSCRKSEPEVLNPNQQTNINTMTELFDSFWDGMNYNYLFWDIEQTDWDQIRSTYRPKFELLNMTDPKDQQIAHQYFTEMTANLLDQHFCLLFSSDDMPMIYPNRVNLTQRENYHDPFTLSELFATYQKKNQQGRITNHSQSSDSTYLVTSFMLDGDIVYFYFSQFMLYEHMDDPKDEIGMTVRNYINILETAPNIKGVVIDVRGNGGGYLNDMDIVMGSLITERQLFARSRSKSGMGRLDYTSWIPCYLNPSKTARKLDVPIVILADMWSLSMSEMTTVAVKSLPNGCFVGERTSGGMGVIYDNEINQAGKFKNDRLEVYMACSEFRDINKISYEGVGIPPTIEAPFDSVAFKNGDDTQLERAVKYIRTKK